MELHDQKTNDGRGAEDGSLISLRKVGLDFFFEPSGPQIWLGVSVCLGTVASFLPAWHAPRRPVREAIGYEWLRGRAFKPFTSLRVNVAPACISNIQP